MSASSANPADHALRLWSPVRAAQLVLFLAVEAGWLFAGSVVLAAWISPRRAAPLLGLPSIAVLLAVGAVAARLRSLRLARAAVVLLGLSLTPALIATGTELQNLMNPSARAAASRSGSSSGGAASLLEARTFRSTTSRRGSAAPSSAWPPPSCSPHRCRPECWSARCYSRSSPASSACPSRGFST